MTLRVALAVACAAAVGSAARAQLVVNANLGLLGGGAVPFSGTTVGRPNNADTYAPAGNSAAIWDQEFVYQFSIAQTSTIGVTTNDPNGATVDNDFFLLNSLATTINVNNLREATILHGSLVEVSGTFGSFPAGTYFLSIDAWRGNPTGSTTPPTGRAGPFSGTLNIAPLVAPAATQTLLGGSLTGSLAAGEIDWYVFEYGGSGGFVLDTLGSTLGPSNDTELGLFNSGGALVASNDDIGGGSLLSRITSPVGLPAGTYYLAIGGFNTLFGSGFQAASTSSNTGAYVINGIAIPEPALAGLILPAMLALSRRRRR